MEIPNSSGVRVRHLSSEPDSHPKKDDKGRFHEIKMQKMILKINSTT